MQNQILPAKLLLSIANKGSGRILVEASRRGGARGATRLSARTPKEDAADAARAGYSVQDVVIILMWDEAESVVASVLESVAGSPERIDGASALIDVPGALSRSGFFLDATQTAKGDTMKPGSMMIVSITNHGEAEALMSVARKAGAKGGTIIDARGTVTEADRKYFGISLTQEKEILIIISDAAQSGAILEALGSQPLFDEPGGGIVFAVPVERFIPLKNLDEASSEASL